MADSSFLLVDETKCTGDGACVTECPRLIIEMPAGRSVPTAVEGAAQLCLDCGHCVAVCPTGALSLETLPSAACPSAEPEELPSAEQIDLMLRARRSVRSFERRAIAREQIEHLIDVARYAPTGSNRQPVSWIVVYDSEIVAQVAKKTERWIAQSSGAVDRSRAIAAERGLDRICRGAPHLVLALTPEGRGTDGAIALTFLELAASAAGLGACWAGYVTGALRQSPELRELVGVPEGQSVAGGMLLGYPRFRYHRIPRRKDARIAWR